MRNHSFDSLKFICTILVIFIHTPQPSGLELYIDPLQRCAVPIFFMLSGYFTYGKTNLNEKIHRRIISISKLFGWAFLFYMLIFIVHNKPSVFFDVVLKQVHEFVCFNNVLFCKHLWYIHAYLYILVIMLFVNRCNLYKPLFYATPILLITALLLGKYDEVIFARDIPTYISRNFIFTGIPFFAIGMFIRKKRDVIQLCVSKNKIIMWCLFFYVAGVVENIVFDLYHNQGDLYLTTTPLAFCIFIMFLNTYQAQETVFSKIGEEDSLYIYIFHVFLADKMFSLCNRLELLDYYSYISVPAVFVITIVFIKVLRKIKIIGRLI